MNQNNTSLNITEYQLPTLHLVNCNKESLTIALKSKMSAGNISTWLQSQPIVLNIKGINDQDLSSLNLEELQKTASELGFYICGISAGGDKDLANKLEIFGIKPFPEINRKNNQNKTQAEPQPQAEKATNPSEKIEEKENNSQKQPENDKEKETTKEEVQSSNVSSQNASAEPQNIAPKINPNTTLIHYGNVRSGTQLYAKGKSLVVIGNVGDGADVVADDCIFIIGKASGRIMAGASGNRDSIVYCKHFNPQLISIAGIYKANEDIGSDFIDKQILAKLNADSFNFEIQN